ncbi:MAG: transposase [Treponema sp.]|nr:transposase [Treponema sp.]
MYKKREFVEGAFYHVTSRTNNKIRVFDNKLGRKIMLITLQNAKDKYHFQLANFCVMPTHIHLLIKPAKGTCLSNIMHWIKIHSAKSWNFIHGSADHMWGNRYFSRAVKDEQEFEFIMNYIDQNPVVAGLVSIPDEWKASGAFYKALNIEGLIDFNPHDCQRSIKLLSPIPFLVSNLLPSAQLDHVIKYYGVYVEALEYLYDIVSKMPKLQESASIQDAPAYLHYYTGTADYFIYEYDRQDTMYGRVCANVYPARTEYCIFSLENLKNKPLMKLDFSWR